MNRRSFLRTGTAGATSLLAILRSRTGAVAQAQTVPAPAAVASGAGASPWLIGCFNRAWTKWSYDEALDGIQAAGYKVTGLLSAHRGEAFTSPAATPAYLNALRQRIARRGLTVNMTALQYRPEAALQENLDNTRKQIENAARLQLQFVLTFGVDKPAHYQDFYRVMANAAAQGEKEGLQLVMKPHGGASGSSAEILRCIQSIGHPNFKIWYDAGNIIYYTGKDPVLELAPIVEHVTGFCAKDCPGPKGEVMSQFGTGKVNFKAVFTTLKAAGFKGPIMVEGVKVGATAAETTAHAKANREYLESVLALV